MSENEIMTFRYQRAKEFIEGYLSNTLVQNDTIFPNWIEGKDQFWYERYYKISEDGKIRVAREYRLVDAAAATNIAAFDHLALAMVLSKISGQIVNKESLPITHVLILLDPLTVCFNAFGSRWQFAGITQTCKLVTDIEKIDEALSPDGKLIAFSRDCNLWVRDVETGDERALTTDGEEDYAYGVRTSAPGMRFSPEVPAIWSPDSTRLLAVLRDKRKVKTFPMVDHVPRDGSIRPFFSESKVAYPGDEDIETYLPLSIDVSIGKPCFPNNDPIPSCDYETTGLFNNHLLWWSEDNRFVFFIHQMRGNKLLKLIEFDINTGSTRCVLEETSDTYINLSHDVIGYCLHRVLTKSNELIWWSERDGRGHLYLYDLEIGVLKNRITQGDWVVRDVLHLDEKSRELWIQTSGREPGRDAYYRDICRINIDTGELVAIVSSNDEAIVHCYSSWPVLFAVEAGRASELTNGVSPSGGHVVATITRADRPSVTSLFNRDGQQILELETTDISGLPEGWHWPEPVTTIAVR